MATNTAKIPPTPGPWTALQLNWGYQIVAYPFPGRPVQADVIAAIGGKTPNPRDDRRARADATLIAATPQLLAACRQARDWLGRFAAHAPIHFGGEVELIDVLDRAIGVAEGGEHRCGQ